MDEIADRVARDRTNAARERFSTHETQFAFILLRKSPAAVISRAYAATGHAAAAPPSSVMKSLAHLVPRTTDGCSGGYGSLPSREFFLAGCWSEIGIRYDAISL
jgi:hypothetical protein